MSTAQSTTEMIGLELVQSPTSPRDFKGKVTPDWCKGCGDFGVLNALQRAVFELYISCHNLAIGCARGVDFNR